MWPVMTGFCRSKALWIAKAIFKTLSTRRRQDTKAYLFRTEGAGYTEQGEFTYATVYVETLAVEESFGGRRRNADT